MNKFVNQLLQIQDLEVALRAHEVIKGREDLRVRKRLESDIKALGKSLPEEIRENFFRLVGHYGLAVCPMVNGSCQGCFLRLPVGVANLVLSDSQCVNCPSCGRFLFSEQPVQRPAPAGGVSASSFHGLGRFSSPELLTPDLKAKSKRDAIARLGMLAGEKGFVPDGPKFVESLLLREALASTSVGSGIAFPHARGVRACGLVLAVGMDRSGLKFDDGPKVHLLFVSAVPTQTSIFYLDLVSRVARFFSKPDHLKRFLQCETATAMWKILLRIK